MTGPALLTESEVAKRLRCSTEKVKRLRLSGRLAYHRGRPVLIDEADRSAYLETIRCPAQVAAEPAAAPPVKSGIEEASARARRTWLLRQMRQGH